MFKFITLIITFLIGRLNSHKDNPSGFYEDMTDMAVSKVKSAALANLKVVGGVLLGSVGFIATYFNLLSQYDEKGYVVLSAVSSGGLVLLLGGVSFIYLANYNNRKIAAQKEKLRQQTASRTVSPIETAVSALIMDFVKDRELQRDLKINDFKQSEPYAQNFDPDFAQSSKEPQSHTVN